MAMGRRPDERQQELWIASEDVVSAPGHVFYEELNGVLRDHDFDRWIEDLCQSYYKQFGRKSIPPGVYFRMLMVGYFEDISSFRGIAWRCADSLSLKAFLGVSSHKPTPDHSSLSRISDRLPEDVYHSAFDFVLKLVSEHGLLSGKTLGVDSTQLEANAAMKSIVRKDTGADWLEHLKKQAAAEDIEINNRADAARYDKRVPLAFL